MVSGQGPGTEEEGENYQDVAPESKGPVPEEGSVGADRPVFALLPSCWVACRTSLSSPESERVGPYSLLRGSARI